jgi:chemotaxis protein CheD
MVHVVQGEFQIVSDPSIVLTTLLGSCVSTCMWDPVAEIGGMNHFLLPGNEGSGDELKYGVNAMELLINGLLQGGALRSRLQAKLFGGAQVVQNLSDVGSQNARFAQRFLSSEGIPCQTQSLGGLQGRRIRFWPTTGRAAQMLIDSAHPEVQVSERRMATPAPNPAAGSVELF